MVKELPIYQKKEEILTALKNHQVIIVIGETGCGKTTQIPQIIYDSVWSKRGLIGCTEPRRVAAYVAAKRVAEERNWRLGQEVGFEVRFEKEVSNKTKIKFMTDGILMQEVNTDPLLETYQIIMVDEAHERNIYTDFLLSYLKGLLTKRPTLRLIISSATINPRQFADYFNNSAIVNIPFKIYPVEIEYRQSSPEYIQTAVEEVKKIYQSKRTGDILIFMPGLGEISRTIDQLNQLHLKNVVCLPLYGNIDPQEQTLIFQEFKERKIIVATNVAETSITIPGVRWVIDTGRAKIPGFNLEQGISTLQLESISQASANQRAGRAGRTNKGTCIRLYSEAEFRCQDQFNTPGILSGTGLTNIVLQSKAYNIDNLSHLDLLTQPDSRMVLQAENTLKSWGALDESGKLTNIGELMHRLPLSAKLSRLVILSREFGCIREAVTIAAFLSVRDIFLREMGGEFRQDNILGDFQDKQSDLLTFLNLWCGYAKLNDPKDSEEWCLERNIMPRLMQGIKHIQSQVLERLNLLRIPFSRAKDSKEVIAAIANIFKANLCVYHRNYDYRCGDIYGIKIVPNSTLWERLPEYFISYNLVKVEGRVFARYNTEIDGELLEKIAPDIWESIRRPMIQVPTNVTNPIKLKGFLRIDHFGGSRVINVDMDMQRILSNQLKMITNNSVIIEESKFPLTSLRLSKKTESMLIKKGIDSLACLPKTRVGLSSLYLTDSQIKEVMYKLRKLGYLKRNRLLKSPEIPTQKVDAEETKEIREQVLLDRQNTDWLIDSFLDKPVKALGLSGGATIRLIANGVSSIRELISKTKKELLRLEKFTHDHLAEVKEKLAFYDLKLRSDPLRAWGFGDWGELQEIEFAKTVTDEEAREILGDEMFELFKSYKEAKTFDEQITIRNKITVLNLGLPAKFAYWRYFNLQSLVNADPAIDLYDLYQEGSMGLMRATVKFDYSKGFRFSTYASQWIKQFMNRALQCAGILPVHIIEALGKLVTIRTKFYKEFGYYPDLEEMARRSKMPIERVQFLIDYFGFLDFYGNCLSLDDDQNNKEGNGDEPVRLLDLLRAPDESEGGEVIDKSKLAERISIILRKTPLLGIQKRFLELYFGLTNEGEYTLREIADMYGITWQRVHQQIDNSLEVLRTPEVWEQIREFFPTLPQPSAKASRKRKIMFTELGEMLMEWEEKQEQRKEQQNSITTKQLLNIVAKFFEITVDDLVGKSREKELVVPRQIAMYLMREEMKFSFPNIAQELGGRDHTTAIHACTKIGEEIKNSEEIREDVELIRQIVCRIRERIEKQDEEILDEY